jgi:hypothetical protein
MILENETNKIEKYYIDRSNINKEQKRIEYNLKQGHKIKCNCGVFISKRNIQKHLQTKSHQTNI